MTEIANPFPPKDIPLDVDFDGTLVAIDVEHETTIRRVYAVFLDDDGREFKKEVDLPACKPWCETERTVLV